MNLLAFIFCLSLAKIFQVNSMYENNDLPNFNGWDQEAIDNFFMEEAFKEARYGHEVENGIPIASVIVFDNKILSKGHNQRLQRNDPIQHGEMNALENGGVVPSSVYQRATIYTTLSPCDMCTGALNFYKFSRVVIGDNISSNKKYGENLLREIGVDVVVLNKPEIINYMQAWIKGHNDIWMEADSLNETCLNGYNDQIGSLHPMEENSELQNSPKGVNFLAKEKEEKYVVQRKTESNLEPSKIFIFTLMGVIIVMFVLIIFSYFIKNGLLICLNSSDDKLKIEYNLLNECQMNSKLLD
jgi:creatinine deaminase